MKTLLVMRHGKSDWNAEYDRDHERPLNPRGIRSAEAMGRVLSEEGMAPQLVITSSAVRARTTAHLAAKSGEWECDIRIEPRLYGSGVDAAMEAAAEVESSDPLMLVGHQPTWSMLVTTLTGEQADVKTATVVVVEFDMSDWSDIATNQGNLVRVYQPRDYLG